MIDVFSTRSNWGCCVGAHLASPLHICREWNDGVHHATVAENVGGRKSR